MLVVRVKRNREDEPAETICIVEGNSNSTAPGGNAKKRKKFEDLSLTTKENDREEQVQTSGEERRSRLILKRFTTIDHKSESTTSTTNDPSLLLPSISKKSLDDRTISLLKKRSDQEASSIQPENRDSNSTDTEPRKRAKVIIAQQRRALPIEGAESCILVDMMQVYSSPPSATSTSADPQAKSAAATKILDPATRLLREGILVAIQKNDFNDISAALMKGANPDFQLEEAAGGYTSLMAAAMRGNLRMVKRLLLHGVDATKRNKDGLSAIDLLKKPSRSTQKDYEEMRFLLQEAAVKSFEQSISRPKKTSTTRTAEGEDDQEYVYDVYCLDPSPLHRSQSSLESCTQSKEEGAAMVTVEGLRILEDGQVECFEYDSDWSDLADDEDPDSNDERYFANDYPDEDSEDNGGERYFRENEEGDSFSSEGEGEDKARFRLAGPRARARARARPAATSLSPSTTASDLLLQTSSSYSSRKRQAVRSRHLQQEEAERDIRLEEEVEEESLLIEQQLEQLLQRDLGGGGLGETVFDRSGSVGRVLRPHFIDSPSSSEHYEPRRLDSERLRALWEEETEESQLDRTPHDQRVFDMRQRTNMLFASNPKEFDRSGLPKYGAELSDDDLAVPYTTMVEDEEDELRVKPCRDAIAYDSELDREDSD